MIVIVVRRRFVHAHAVRERGREDAEKNIVNIPDLVQLVLSTILRRST